MNKIVTRFAPSPTGLLHAGNYRTAVFAYLFARKHGGTFILRIEDTDRERSKPEFEANILDALQWLSIDHDVFVRQSECVAKHEEAIIKLLDGGFAYESTEAHPETGIERTLIRFKNPGGTVTFTDAIRGEITTDVTDLGDFVVAKSRTEPLFHIANVVDDGESGVTHIIRGEDHISNTPRQILMVRALGYPEATYAHLPLVLASDRAKLSKRRGALPLTTYRDMGYLPNALLNYLSLLGFHPEGEQEIFTPEELAEVFDLSRIQKGGAIFDPVKLLWVNNEHMRRMPEDVFEKEIRTRLAPLTSLSEWSEERFIRALPTIGERIKVFGDIDTHIEEGELSYLFEPPTVSSAHISWKDTAKEVTQTHLAEMLTRIQTLAPFPSESETEEALISYANEVGRGAVLWPLRYSLSGKERSPGPFTLIHILGRDAAYSRIKNAYDILDV